MFSLFKRKKKKKQLTEGEIALKLASRVVSVEPDWDSMSQTDRDDFSYSVLEKKEFFEARRLLKYLPPTGTSGGIIQSIASALQISRQYAHQIFFPPNPERLFSGRAKRQKDAWRMLSEKVSKHPMLPKYKAVFDGLMEGRTVQLKIAVARFKWIKKHASEICPGLEIVMDKSTLPTTYTLTPPKRVRH